MKVQLISYHYELEGNARLKLTTELINDSKASIMLFAGHTITTPRELEKLKKRITNTKTTAFLELKDINSNKISNCLFKVAKGEVKNLYTNQLFATSDEIKGSEELANRLLHELATNRSHKVKGYRVLLLQCGELNILKNIQSEDNRVEFRFSENEKMKEKFQSLIDNHDIFLNPIHSPMGNQGKMKQRRIYLSADGGHYFSTSNTDPVKDLAAKSIQYALYDGEELTPINELITEQYLLKTFDI